MSQRTGLLHRLRAAFQPAPLQPSQQGSFRIPDLDRWAMPHRSVDMADWTVARNMATNNLTPDRTRLLDLYDSILVDSHLASTMESRVLRVVRGRFRLVDTKGQPQPEKARLLEKPWFEDFLAYAAEAVFRGHTLIELGRMARPGELLEVNRIDPRNVLPWSGVVARRRGDTTGYLFREPPLNAYFIEVGRPDELGLLCDIAPAAIVKKYAVGSWSDYVYKYGIPPRWVRTSSRDARRFKQLEAMMQNMLSSAYGVIEGDEEIQIMPTPGTDAHKVFNELIVRMNSEISKRILGQDGTSDNKDASGTYGSLQVLAKVAEDRHQADKASVGYLINGELLPRLINLGYPFQGLRFEWDTLQDLAPMELVDAVSKLGLVYDIDPQHVEERTGIRILGARRMPGELGPGPGNPPGMGRQGGGNPPKPTGEDGGEENDEDGDGITASWGGRANVCGICGGGGEIAAAAVPPFSLEAIVSLLRSAWDGAQFDATYFDAVADLYMVELHRVFDPAKMNIAPEAPEHVAHALMESNLFHFSGLKTLALTLDVNAMAKQAGTFADFKRRVDESKVMAKYNVNDLRTEFTNVAQSGLQAGRYYQMQQTADVLPYGEYVTVGDGRVRQAHEALNHKKWPLEHRAWDHIWPPNGWNCRCTILPTEAGASGKNADTQWENAKAELARRGEWARMEKWGFDGNRAISGSIFDLNTAFRKKLSAGRDDGLKRLFRLNLDDTYGRKDMTQRAIQARGGLPALTPQLTGEGGYSDWFRRQADIAKDSKGRAVFKDYSGKPWVLDKATLERHTGNQSGKDYTPERRWEYVHAIPEILAAPDEVWSKENRTGRVDWRFVKFYQGRTIIVRAEIPNAADKKGAALEITSWHELKLGGMAKDDKDQTVRNGVPIKKMMPT